MDIEKDQRTADPFVHPLSLNKKDNKTFPFFTALNALHIPHNILRKFRRRTQSGAV